MYNIDLQHLKVIRAIHKEGTMKQAAETLRLSQSALSHHIKKLERSIGTNVFDRRNKKLWITEAGAQILESSDVIIAELVKLENNIGALKEGVSGTIRISTECYTTYTWLPSIIVNFNRKYPQAHVQIVAEATQKPVNYLQNGKLDIALVSRINNLQPTLKCTALFNDELMVVVNRENPLSKHKSVYPKDLAEQVLIVYDSDDKDIDILQRVLKPNNIAPRRIIKMQLTEVIVEMVKADLGVAVMAKWLVAPLMNKNIVLLPFNDAFARRTWHLVTHQNTNVLQKKFIDFAIAELNENRLN